MFEAITWLVTNRCQLRCTNCSFAGREISESGIEALVHAVRVFASWPGNEKRFVCLLGGDIGTLPHPLTFLEALNFHGLPYGWQTNCYPPANVRALIPHLKNLSLSIDSVVIDHSNLTRMVNGLFSAGYARAINPAIDIHATITIDASNLEHVHRTAHLLSDLGIWVELTFAHWRKPGFDLVPARDSSALSLEHAPLIRELSTKLLRLKRAGGLIHSSEEFLHAWSDPKLPIDLGWKCSGPANLVLDSDLSVRCCLHLPGKRVRTWTVWDLADTDRWPAFLADWMADQEELCPRCFWDCQFEALNQQHKNGNPDWFAHQG